MADSDETSKVPNKFLISLLALVPFLLAAAIIATVVYAKTAREPLLNSWQQDIALWGGAAGLFYIITLLMMLPDWK